MRELRLIVNGIWEQYKSSRPDQDGDDPFEDRWLHLDTTIDGAGRVRGDLSAQCAASLQAVLDALGKKNGPDDTPAR